MPTSVGRSDVATVPAAGGEPVVVTQDATTNWNPVWSPDGKKLCGNFEGKNGTGLGYYSFETGRYEKLSDIYAIPSWLPDSRRFVFAHEVKAFIADTATKKVRELYARPPEQIRSVGVSRDGRLLYYTLLSTESDIWLLNLE